VVALAGGGLEMGWMGHCWPGEVVGVIEVW
jgi:hypothetical protein